MIQKMTRKMIDRAKPSIISPVFFIGIDSGVAEGVGVLDAAGAALSCGLESSPPAILPALRRTSPGTRSLRSRAPEHSLVDTGSAHVEPGSGTIREEMDGRALRLVVMVVDSSRFTEGEQHDRSTLGFGVAAPCLLPG